MGQEHRGVEIHGHDLSVKSNGLVINKTRQYRAGGVHRSPKLVTASLADRCGQRQHVLVDGQVDLWRPGGPDRLGRLGAGRGLTTGDYLHTPAGQSPDNPLANTRVAAGYHHPPSRQVVPWAATQQVDSTPQDPKSQQAQKR